MADPRDLIQRAADELLELMPEEPTDEELYAYWISTSPEFGCADPVGFARAVLARWGHQPSTPIPLSERQPTDADSDKLNGLDPVPLLRAARSRQAWWRRRLRW